MSDQLKPCPFCGKEPKLVDYFIQGIANHKNYFVKCIGGCGIQTRSRKNPEGAIEDWNNRPIEDAQSALIEQLGEALEAMDNNKFSSVTYALTPKALTAYREWKKGKQK